MDDDSAPVLTRYKLDTHDYHHLARVGILHEDSRVELIDGELIEMAPIGLDHAFVVDALNELLTAAGAGRAHVSPQNSFPINRYNEPQPDFLVARPRADRYRRSRPGPEDLIVLIEVANSSLAYDRRVKLPLYAHAGVAEYWIFDLAHRTVEVHRRPGPEGYAETTTHGPDETLAPALAPEIRIDLGRVFD